MIVEKTALTLFGLYTLFVLCGSLLAIFSRSLVRALTGLMLAFFGVAGLYLLMAAPFIAFMQLLIYLGAIVVLIFLAIMLIGAGGLEEKTRLTTPRRYYQALAAAAAIFSVLGITATYFCLPPQVLPDQISITALGKALMNDYVLPFELISVVLFVAMAGAVLLTFERKHN
ncbi:NADH-quinone oxidoreductase subunit J [Desulfovibrionales bacterium]